MATYEPPTADLPEFDTLVFTSLEENLTIAEADTRYLRFPLAQGDETIPNLTVGGTLTADDIEPSTSSSNMVIGGTQIDGTLNIGTLAGRTGAINIGTGADGVSARTISIGNATGAVGNLNLKTRTIAIGGGNCVSATTDAGTISLTATGTATIGGQNALLRPSALASIGDTMGSGEIRIGRADASSTSTVINIGTGTAATGQINIGTGNITGSAQTIQLGRAGTGSNVNIGFWNYNGSNGQLVYQGGGQIGATGNLNIFPNATSAFTMGVGMTAGSLTILPSDGTISSTPLNIATGSAYTGNINIGTGATAKNITIGSGAGGTTLIRGGTITLVKPITPSYTPSSILSTTLGYTDFPTASAFGTMADTASNIAQFSIGAGVWDVKSRVRISSVSAVAGNFFRIGLTTSSTSLGTLYGDWNQDGQSGAINVLVSNTFAVNITTTIYVRGICKTGGGGPCDVVETIATRIA